MAFSEITTDKDIPIDTELTEGMIREFSTTSGEINIQFVRKQISPTNTERVKTFKSAQK